MKSPAYETLWVHRLLSLCGLAKFFTSPKPYEILKRKTEIIKIYIENYNKEMMVHEEMQIYENIDFSIKPMLLLRIMIAYINQFCRYIHTMTRSRTHWYFYIKDTLLHCSL